MRCSRDIDGLTLVEIVTAVTVAFVLVGIAVPSFSRTVAKADGARIVSDAHTVRLAVEGYAADNSGKLPSGGVWGRAPGTLAKELGPMPFRFKTIEYRLVVNHLTGLVRLRVRYPRNDPIGNALRDHRRSDGTVTWRRGNTDFYLRLGSGCPSRRLCSEEGARVHTGR